MAAGASHRPRQSRAAFPEKSAAEIERILRGVWDNLGRVGAEFAHLDRLWDYDIDRAGRGRIEFRRETNDRFMRLRDDGKPALIFAAHLANWELPALAAPRYGIDTACSTAGPTSPQSPTRCSEIARRQHGHADPDRPGRAAEARRRAAARPHVGMLVDQYYGAACR